MSKFIFENNIERKKLSLYYNDNNKKRLDYLISILGDVEMSIDELNMYLSQFNRVVGPYDVLTEPSTIKAMYNIKKLYPKLSTEAINSLFPKYIEDLFEKEDLINKLKKFIDIFGYNDEMYEIYLSYVDRKGSVLQEKYKKMLSSYNEFRIDYSSKFIHYLEYLTLRKHYEPKKILEHIPTEEFVKKDEDLLSELSRRYRIHFGICYPISYNLIEESIKDNIEDENTKELEYIVKINGQSIAKKSGFSQKDFRNSVKAKKLELK